MILCRGKEGKKMIHIQQRQFVIVNYGQKVCVCVRDRERRH